MQKKAPTCDPLKHNSYTYGPMINARYEFFGHSYKMDIVKERKKKRSSKWSVKNIHKPFTVFKGWQLDAFSP